MTDYKNKNYFDLEKGFRAFLTIFLTTIFFVCFGCKRPYHQVLQPESVGNAGEASTEVVEFREWKWIFSNGVVVKKRNDDLSGFDLMFEDADDKNICATYATDSGGVNLAAAVARDGELVFEANSTVPNPFIFLGIGNSKEHSQIYRFYSLDDRVDTWEEVRVPLVRFERKANGDLNWKEISKLTFRTPKIRKKEINGGTIKRAPKAFTLSLRNVRIEYKKNLTPHIVNYKGNLMRNGSSFEAGRDWISLRQCILPGEKQGKIAFDTSTSVHGKTSLLVERPDGKQPYLALLSMCPFRARKGKRITVSAYMKCSEPSAQASIRLMGPGWGWVGPKDKKRSWGFRITDKWQRYHFDVVLTGKRYGGYAYNGAYYLDFNCGAKKFWIDAVQVEEGDLTEFKPGSAIDLSLKTNNKRNTFFPGNRINLEYKIFNNSCEDKLTLAVNVEDFWGKKVFSQKIPLVIKTGNGAEGKLAFTSVDRVGWYRAKASVTGKGVREDECRIFGVLHRIPEGINQETAFHGTHPAKIVTRAHHAWFVKGKNPQAYPSLMTGGGAYTDIEEYLRHIRDSGFLWIRGHGSANYHWKEVELSPGKYTIHGNIQEAVESLNMRHMLTLGNANAWSVKNFSMGPDWHKTGETVKGSWFTMKVADPEAYAKFFSSIVKRFKGKRKYYHVINEPDSGMDAKTYIYYLKAAYTAAKQVDPECKIIGIGGTSDFGGDKLRFFRECIDLGALDYLDVISIHYADCSTRPGPEAYRQGPPGYVAIPLIRKWAKEKTGRDIPVWDTEISEPEKLSALGIPHPFGEEISTSTARSERAFDVMWAARSSILDYCNGVQRRFQFMFDSFNDSLGNQRSGCTYFDGTPTAVLLAYNTQTLLLCDAKPKGTFRLGPHDWVWCGEIKKGNGYLYALWCGDNKPRTLVVKLPPSIKVLDIFGNPKKSEKNGGIHIDGFVTYILSDTNLQQAIRNATITNKRKK